MTKTELEGYRQQLLALGRRLNGNVEGLASEAFRRTGGEASGNLSNTPMHLADLGTDTFEQEVAMSLLENEGQQVEEVAAALRRIDEGTYGQCEECGEAIGRERLHAVPYTRHCIDCARRQEESQATEMP